MLRRRRGKDRPQEGRQTAPVYIQEVPVNRVLGSVVDILRDQVAAQQETASTNELTSIGLMGASLAMVVALLLLKAAHPIEISYWWWYPLPIFVASGLLLMIPAVPRVVRRVRLSDGPNVPALMARLSEMPVRSTRFTWRSYRALQTSWAVNDRILRTERACVRYGEYVLAIGALVSVGLYSLGLN